MEISEAKTVGDKFIEDNTKLLLDTSHHIHETPELCFEEHDAHDTLATIIEAQGIEVQRGAYGLDTAFSARVGTSGPNIAVICEYDALPGIGHGCGHNIIATAGLGAGLAAAQVAEALGGSVTIMGTPAEEGGGGKVYMLEAGAFDDVDAAIMVHPAGDNLELMDTLAIHRMVASYQGRSAHAAAAPHLGTNALDAAVNGYNAVAALRQHITPEERIHGIFTKAGEKPNIVPDYAEAEWYVRSTTLPLLQELKARVVAALEGGAQAAGCTCEIAWDEVAYSHLVTNPTVLSTYAANAAALGRAVQAPEVGTSVAGSTDMGNVSCVVPGIHPMIQSAPSGTAIHTREFEHHAGTEMGDAAVIDGARILMHTVADLIGNATLVPQAKAEFDEVAQSS